MIQPGRLLFAPVPNLLDTRFLLETAAHLLFESAILQVNMGHLVIRHRERPTRSTVEDLPAKLLLDGDPALLAEQPVQVDRGVHRGDSIFGEEDHPHVPCPEEVDQITGDLVDGADVLGDVWMFRSQPLQIVIEVRQINQTQGRLMPDLDPFRRFGNPARRGLGRALRSGSPGGRSPERGKGKLAQVLLDLRAHGGGSGVDIKNFSAVGRVDGTRSDRIIRAGIHIIPPKHFRTSKTWVLFFCSFPNFFGFH